MLSAALAHAEPTEKSAWEKLSAEERKTVDAHHEEAFRRFKIKDYSGALSEIRKVRLAPSAAPGAPGASIRVEEAVAGRKGKPYLQFITFPRDADMSRPGKLTFAIHSASTSRQVRMKVDGWDSEVTLTCYLRE